VRILAVVAAAPGSDRERCGAKPEAGEFRSPHSAPERITRVPA
jgi:hypothetical protein